MSTEIKYIVKRRKVEHFPDLVGFLEYCEFKWSPTMKQTIYEMFEKEFKVILTDVAAVGS
jgi:hypothetical protein